MVSFDSLWSSTRDLATFCMLMFFVGAIVAESEGTGRLLGDVASVQDIPAILANLNKRV